MNDKEEKGIVRNYLAHDKRSETMKEREKEGRFGRKILRLEDNTKKALIQE